MNNHDSKKNKSKNNQEDITIVREHKKINPNDPCPCGGGKKFKKCCRLV